MVLLWKLVLNPTFGGLFTLYELLPAFVLSCICIVVVSLLTKKPSADIVDIFDAAKAELA
jgi:sodium/proline symporter